MHEKLSLVKFNKCCIYNVTICRTQYVRWLKTLAMLTYIDVFSCCLLVEMFKAAVNSFVVT